MRSARGIRAFGRIRFLSFPPPTLPRGAAFAEVKVGGRIGHVSGAQKIAEGAVSFIPAPVTGDGGIEPLLIAGK